MATPRRIARAAASFHEVDPPLSSAAASLGTDRFGLLLDSLGHPGLQALGGAHPLEKRQHLEERDHREGQDDAEAQRDP